MGSIHFFSTGMARSGTNLVSKILSANPELHSVLGANIELYRSVRDKIMESNNADQKILLPKGSAFSDFFGDPGYFRILQHLFKENFKVEFHKTESEEMRKKGLDRFPHDSPDLKPVLAKINESNSVDYLISFAESIRKFRKISKEVKLGFHESWHIEMFPALQKSFPEAKFLVVLRDVRGAYSSHKFDTIANIDWRVSIFDYARQFRKFSALAHHFAINYKNFKIVRYEDLMETPEKTVREMCNFLEVEFQLKMLDPRNHIEPSSSKVWDGNSGYGKPVSGFDSRRSLQWKTKLEANEISGIELMCEQGLLRNNYPIEGMYLGRTKDILMSLENKSRAKFNRWDQTKRKMRNFADEEEAYFNTIATTPKLVLKEILQNYFSPDFFYF